MTELVVVLVLRTRRRAWESRPGRVLWVSTLVMLGVALVLPWVRPVAGSFGLIPLPPGLMLIAVVVVLAYAAATEAAKAWFYRQARGRA
jgi:Mg2+-importing ATPase